MSDISDHATWLRRCSDQRLQDLADDIDRLLREGKPVPRTASLVGEEIERLRPQRYPKGPLKC